MPTTSSPRSSRRCAQCMPMKPATPVSSTFISTALRAPQLDQLGVLDVAVHAANGDVQQARQAVEEAQAHEIELDEPHHRREEEVEDAGAAPLLEGLARGERGVAVLTLEVRRQVVGGI